MTNTLWRPFGGELFEPFGSTGWDWPDNPLAELNRLSAEMDRMFRRFGGGDRSFAPAVAYPALDMWQDENSVYVEAELPGMEIGDLEIYVTGGNQLSIRGRAEAAGRGGRHLAPARAGLRPVQPAAHAALRREDRRSRSGVQGRGVDHHLPKSEAAKPRRLAIKAE